MKSKLRELLLLASMSTIFENPMPERRISGKSPKKPLTAKQKKVRAKNKLARASRKNKNK